MFEDVIPNSDRWFSLNNLLNEEWKDVKDFDGLYQISNYGRVKSLKRNTTFERILKYNIKTTGYCYVGLTKNCKTKHYRVHRLLAQTFLPNPNNLPQVNHKKEFEKWNNRVDNLEWCDSLYNCNYGTRKQRIGKKQYLKIDQYDLCGDFIKTWNSMTQVHEELGYNISHISDCCNNKRKSANGYMWKKYIEKEK